MLDAGQPWGCSLPKLLLQTGTPCPGLGDVQDRDVQMLGTDLRDFQAELPGAGKGHPKDLFRALVTPSGQILGVLLAPCALEKKSCRLRTPISHLKFDIFSANVNLCLIFSLGLTLLL